MGHLPPGRSALVVLILLFVALSTMFCSVAMMWSSHTSGGAVFAMTLVCTGPQHGSHVRTTTTTTKNNKGDEVTRSTLVVLTTAET